MTKKASKLKTKKVVPPAQVKFFDTTAGKSIKTLIYLCVSAVLTTIVTYLTDNPDFIGQYSEIAIFIITNVVLVALKNLADPQVKNI